MVPDRGFQFSDALMADFAHDSALTLRFNVFFGYFAKGFVENRDFVLDPESYVCVIVKGAFPRFVNIGGFKGRCFIAVCLRQFDAAIPSLMLHITPAEDNQAGF